MLLFVKPDTRGGPPSVMRKTTVNSFKNFMKLIVNMVIRAGFIMGR